MAPFSPLIEHLVRRAGFGLGWSERGSLTPVSYEAAVSWMLDYDPATTDVDRFIGNPGYVQVRGFPWSPNTVITDARQRWMFRMVHSPAPLQEKMALFWHHHFATAYGKVGEFLGGIDGTRAMAAKPQEDPNKARGQIELFREFALGSFRDLLLEVAKDPAMLVWLDGRTNTKNKPQENFGRELMELFTIGVGNFVETDVYAAARVFTGWNLATGAGLLGFRYDAAQHDTDPKEFSLPIYANGSRTIPARSAEAGIQDGIDLMTTLAYSSETARRLAGRLWTWFVSEIEPPPADFVDSIATVYLQNETKIRPVLAAIFRSPHFTDPGRFFARYSWPVEYVIRALKEVGFLGFSLENVNTPMFNMGQLLFEPPDVNGWELGPGWFSTSSMLARMNFAATLTTNQKFELLTAARPSRASPESLLAFALDRLRLPPLEQDEIDTFLAYLRAGGAWTGSDDQLLVKTAGLFHLAVGSGEYQFI